MNRSPSKDKNTSACKNRNPTQILRLLENIHQHHSSSRRQPCGIKSNQPPTYLFGQYFFWCLFVFVILSCLPVFLLPVVLLVPISLMSRISHILLKNSAQVQCHVLIAAAVPLAMGFNHLQKTPTYLTTKDHHLELCALRHNCVLPCKHGCHGSSQKGLSDLTQSSVCILVTETHRDVSVLTNLMQLGAFERNITKREH